MKRLKLFLSNMLIYGLGGALSGIIQIVMLPIITRLLPDTTYFGINDISTVVVSFGSALAIMGMYDAMFRFFFDQEDLEYKKSICSSAFFFTLITSVLISCILVVFRDFFANLFFGSERYTNIMVLSAMSIFIGSTNSIISAPTRFNNQRKRYLKIHLLSPLISYTLSLILLLRGWYLVALPLATVVSALSVEVFFGIYNRSWFSVRMVNFKYISSMLKFALPLAPNFFIYWIFNSADRLMIADFLGNDHVGVYAAGAKIGQASQLLYSAFAGGWQYFAFSTMRDKDQVDLISNIFEYLAAVAFSISILMAACSKFIFQLLFTGDYVQGFVVVPYLFLSPLLLMLFQVGSNQLLVIKKTWPSIFILFLGAVLNVAVNIIMIPVLGIEGAAMATLLGYIVTVTICVLVLMKMKLLRIKKRYIYISILCMFYFIGWRLILREQIGMSLLIAIIFDILIIFSYRKELIQVIKQIH